MDNVYEMVGRAIMPTPDDREPQIITPLCIDHQTGANWFVYHCNDGSKFRVEIKTIEI